MPWPSHTGCSCVLQPESSEQGQINQWSPQPPVLHSLWAVQSGAEALYALWNIFLTGLKDSMYYEWGLQARLIYPFSYWFIHSLWKGSKVSCEKYVSLCGWSYCNLVFCFLKKATDQILCALWLMAIIFLISEFHCFSLLTWELSAGLFVTHFKTFLEPLINFTFAPYLTLMSVCD